LLSSAAAEIKYRTVVKRDVIILSPAFTASFAVSSKKIHKSVLWLVNSMIFSIASYNLVTLCKMAKCRLRKISY